MATTSGGSRKLLWLMMVLLILSSSAAAVALFMVFDRRAASTQGTAPAVQAERKAPIFLSIEPFTVNLADDEYGSRLLYTGITLKLDDAQSKEVLQEYMPQVRSRLLTLFAGKEARQLTAPGDKQRLAEEVLAALEAPMEPEQPALAVDEVLFTEFIVQ